MPLEDQTPEATNYVRELVLDKNHTVFACSLFEQNTRSILLDAIGSTVPRKHRKLVHADSLGIYLILVEKTFISTADLMRFTMKQLQLETPKNLDEFDDMGIIIISFNPDEVEKIDNGCNTIMGSKPTSQHNCEVNKLSFKLDELN